MVTLINKFQVSEGRNDEFERVLAGITEYMSSQPGFLGHKLYRSLRNPGVYVETAQWKDAESHRSAMQAEAFRSQVQQLGGVAKPDPDVFETIDEL
ncbi:antibiotic biosynthesis monooxygenase [Crossiella sp. CA-258035]|uniref:antibiotic biosynthesis monooxygenase family protein n=1 Tax=Crossiella sp. CA-258035 TaxID=2981138 RepID=UPI0024BCAC4F|nr:antibiotic biosynthesis monooxygenase family protein [Crossiella sp. CA-258035]WHT23331.1 antibiotic biosynthesis monooxygenase [Crossiella sp. CA-258035]